MRKDVGTVKKLGRCHILATAPSHQQTSLDAFRMHEFVSMKHPVLVQLLLQEESHIQHVRLGSPPE